MSASSTEKNDVVLGEKTLSVLHEENKASASRASQTRWKRTTRLLKIIPVVVFVLGGLWLWRAENSPWNQPSARGSTASMNAVAQVPLPPPIDPLCKDGAGKAYTLDGTTNSRTLRCDVLTIGASKTSFRAPEGYCGFFLGDIGWESTAADGSKNIWSKDGKTERVAIVYPQGGETFKVIPTETGNICQL